MTFTDFFEYSEFLLMEGSIHERLRRGYRLYDSAGISYSRAVFEEEGRELLTGLYRQYIDIGEKANLPIMLLTPTWRANRDNITSFNGSKDVNGDCFRFLDGIRRTYGSFAPQIAIGGLTGTKNDAYKPEEALTEEEAYTFHQAQIHSLAEAGVDFLIAETLPAASEALGIGRLMAETNLPYILSFIVRDNGKLLDGSTLSDTIRLTDEKLAPRPICYMVNCVHPDNLSKALELADDYARGRIKGTQANASSLSPEELDEAPEIMTSDPEIFSQSMFNLYQKYGIKALGGCCGTNQRHIEEIAKRFIESKQDSLWNAIDSL